MREPLGLARRVLQALQDAQRDRDAGLAVEPDLARMEVGMKLNCLGGNET